MKTFKAEQQANATTSAKRNGKLVIEGHFKYNAGSQPALLRLCRCLERFADENK
jgi:hypothetical protein